MTERQPTTPYVPLSADELEEALSAATVYELKGQITWCAKPSYAVRLIRMAQASLTSEKRDTQRLIAAAVEFGQDETPVTAQEFYSAVHDYLYAAPQANSDESVAGGGRPSSPAGAAPLSSDKERLLDVYEAGYRSAPAAFRSNMPRREGVAHQRGVKAVAEFVKAESNAAPQDMTLPARVMTGTRPAVAAPISSDKVRRIRSHELYDEQGSRRAAIRYDDDREEDRPATVLEAQLESDLALALDHIAKDDAEIERLNAAIEQSASGAIPDGYKLLRDSTHDERSWKEDASHENGNYYCTCCVCGRQFNGHKRRVLCKVCDGERRSPYVNQK